MFEGIAILLKNLYGIDPIFLIWLCAFYQRMANITELILLLASSAR